MSKLKSQGEKKKKQEQEYNISGISNKDKEICLLAISELEHKIAWRKHMCSIIDEDIEFYNEELALQRKDKIDSVHLLEDEIEEQRNLSRKIQSALPDAENSKMQIEEKRVHELDSKLMQINEEKRSYGAKLEALQKKVKSLEIYSASEVSEKIKGMEKQLESEEAEDVLLKRLEQKKRREETFRKEMKDILTDEADSFQDEISGKLDKNFERIIEETRWWEDTVSGLEIETNRLEVVNAIKLTQLRASEKELKRRKKISLRESQQLQEGEADIAELLHRNKEMELLNRYKSEFQNHLKILDNTSERLKESLVAQDDNLNTTFNKIREKENEVHTLEEKLSNEICFGIQLDKFIEKARQFVVEEVKYPLIVTYNGPPTKKNIIEELRCLFEEATKFVYNREDKSML